MTNSNTKSGSGVATLVGAVGAGQGGVDGSLALDIERALGEGMPDTPPVPQPPKFPSPRYVIIIPRPRPARGRSQVGAPPAYSGIDPLGLQFKENVAFTDDAKIARQCQEAGREVHDRATGDDAEFEGVMLR